MNTQFCMKSKKYLIHLFIFFFIGWVISSCVKDNSPYISPVKQDVHANISFMHYADGAPLKFDTLIYVTSTGNKYMINDLQYFVSCIRLHQKGGKWIDINPDHENHYIDARVPDTWQWVLTMTAQEGAMDSISFIFGLDSENNISYRFPDPPERDMFWPQILGGGYHYMKMNLKWENNNIPELRPFMFHLGIGQMYSGVTHDPDSIIGFIQNYFTVKLPLEMNLVNVSTSYQLWIIKMNIDKWFEGEVVFNFSDYPMGIMQNQEGMFMACRNGRNAFEAFVFINPDK